MFTRFASTLTVCLPLLLVPMGAFAADQPLPRMTQPSPRSMERWCICRIWNAISLHSFLSPLRVLRV